MKTETCLRLTIVCLMVVSICGWTVAAIVRQRELALIERNALLREQKAMTLEAGSAMYKAITNGIINGTIQMNVKP